MAPRPVFIHGAGGGATSWELQEPRFEGAVVIALPGHPGGTPLRSVGGYAEWLGASLRELDGPLVLVGHSLGGAIALQVVLNEPDLVAGLVLVATGPRLPVPAQLADAARDDVDAEARRLLVKGWPSIDDETLEREAGRITALGGDTLALDYLACTTWDASARLGEVGVPTLVMAGLDDRLTPPAYAQELADGIPGAILTRIPDVGHWLHKEEPHAVDRLLAGFLARVELAGE